MSMRVLKPFFRIPLNKTPLYKPLPSVRAEQANFIPTVVAECPLCRVSKGRWGRVPPIAVKQTSAIYGQSPNGEARQFTAYNPPFADACKTLAGRRFPSSSSRRSALALGYDKWTGRSRFI